MLADIPGLIEGASEGAGLGHRFLGHVERCAVLLHLIDLTADDPVAAYETVRKELASLRRCLVRQARNHRAQQSRRRSRPPKARRIAGRLGKRLGKTPLARIGRVPPGRRCGAAESWRRQSPPGRRLDDRAEPQQRTARPGSHDRRPQPHIGQARRIVIKVGSALLVDGASGRIRQSWLASLAGDIAAARARGSDVIVVSSGAIALGRRRLGFAAGNPEARAKPGGGRRRPDRASPMPGRTFWPTWPDRRPGSSHPQRHRGAPPLSQRTLHPHDASGRRRGAGDQRKRHGGHRARSASATTTGWPPGCPR